MTELEQYKKAYVTLMGRVDAVITDLEHVNKNFLLEGTTASFTAGKLQRAIREAEEIFRAEGPEDE